MWRIAAFFGANKLVIGLALGLAASVAGVWLYVQNVVKENRALSVEVQAQEREVARLETALSQAEAYLVEVETLYQTQRQRNDFLDEKWDALRNHLRELDSEEVTVWRNTLVPGGIVRGLQDGVGD